MVTRAQSERRRSFDSPPAPGVLRNAQGAEFTVVAPHADDVRVCLFDDSGAERQVDLHRHAHGVWSGFVAGVRAGQRYALRAAGPWEPESGHRHNDAKLLLDPYGRAVEGEVRWSPEIFGHTVDETFGGDGSVRDERDSAPAMPRNVVVDDTFDWEDDSHPFTPWDRTVVYEAHTRGLTALHPDVPEHLRGTYAGVAHPATIAHLKRIGATAIELLPVHASTSEPHLVKLGLSNYWGYNTVGFFAPHPGYAAAHDPQGVVDEFKGMVKLLHREGIEVLLDVVYNHSAEQSGGTGATLSWRGLGQSTYYRLDEHGRDVDVTGCGNSFDLGEPHVIRMVLDSLRYWVEQMHVDGFRFDLAATLGRGHDGQFDPHHPFLTALATDPVLSRVKLIAEPWDVGQDGWQTGRFPTPMVDWNDRFRDTVRAFWLTDLAAHDAGHPGSGVADLATRLAGSPDLFHSRGPAASINYVTAHDGFPMADLTAYSRKHNAANGEDNRDGTDNNRSHNFGTEGHDDVDPATETLRRRSIRNMLATLLLSPGVPMLLGGDEFGRSQGGNNNAYCQDNEVSWFDWKHEPWQEDLTDTVAHLVELRRRHHVLAHREWFGHSHEEGPTLHWYTGEGKPMDHEVWTDPSARTLQAVYESPHGTTAVLLLLHGGSTAREVELPPSPNGTAWRLAWDSEAENPRDVAVRIFSPTERARMCAASMAVFTAG